jgi:hypothetical protein
LGRGLASHCVILPFRYSSCRGGTMNHGWS